MAVSSEILVSLFLKSIFLVFLLNPVNGQGLKVGFYAKSCPKAEEIVKSVIADTMSKAPSLAGPLLRMHFHDCFVRGCDASILLDFPINQTEKSSIPNLSLRGYQIIDRAKTALEKACPKTVSCADIVALAARDVVIASKGPSWEVETGRRDGSVSSITEGNALPSPFANISTLISDWQKMGLSVKDLVVLSGGHTLGTSHCPLVAPRIYNFNGIQGAVDPSLDPNYIAPLRSKCSATDTTSLIEMDPGSFRTFDSGYYMNVAKRRGLFMSDAALLDNEETKAYVKLHATQTYSFFQDFGVSMVKMGRIQVLTGTQGEIRTVCSRVN